MANTTVVSRQTLATRTEAVGKQLNELRNLILSTDAPFTAGMVRGAEEILMSVFNTLSDSDVKDEDL